MVSGANKFSESSAGRTSRLDMTRRESVLMLFIGLFAVTMAILRFDSIQVGSFFDDAHYIVLAKSLFAGRGYHLISYPHAPLETAFPPGWPLLLAPVAALFPTQWTLLKLPAFLLWLGGLVLAYRLLTPRLPHALRLFFMALLALNPLLIGLAGTVMSEPAYIFCSLLTLTLFMRWQEENGRYRWLWLVGALLTAVATVTIRSIGVALLAAICVALLQRLRRSQVWYGAAALAGLLLLAVPLVWFNGRNGGMLLFSQTYSGHVAYISDNLGQMLRFWQAVPANASETLAHAVVPVFNLGLFTQTLGVSLVNLLSLGVLLVVALGFWRMASRATAIEYYVIFYAIIYFVWIVYIREVQIRIALPLVPFALFYLVQAGDWLGRQLGRNGRWLTAAALTLVLLTALASNWQSWRNPLRQQFIDLSVGATWLRDNAPQDAIVMSANPVPDYLYVERLTTEYGRDLTHFLQRIESEQIDYILLHPPLQLVGPPHPLKPFVQDEILPLLQANPQQYELVYQEAVAQVWVYQVKR